MSTGFNCEIVSIRADDHPHDGSWFYILQDWNCPVGAWDWREHATAYGPFASEDDAQFHLQKYQANPGGWSVGENVELDGDDVLRRLVRAAPENLRSIHWP